jgi:hypothetical protein
MIERSMPARSFPLLGLYAPRVLVAGAPSATFRETASNNDFQADCKAHVYTGITAWKVEEIRRRLQSEGKTITQIAANRWEIDTHEYGIVLWAQYNAVAQELYLDIKTISRTFGFPRCSDVWEEIDKQIGIVQGLADPLPSPPPVKTVVEPPPVPVPVVEYPNPIDERPATGTPSVHDEPGASSPSTSVAMKALPIALVAAAILLPIAFVIAGD